MDESEDEDQSVNEGEMNWHRLRDRGWAVCESELSHSRQCEN